MPIISGILKDGAGQPIAGCTIQLKAVNTTSAVIRTTTARVGVTAGAYRIEALPARYEVTLAVEDYPPQKVGIINVYADSPDGTLNDFLTATKVEYLTPDVMNQFNLLAQQSREAADAAKAASQGVSTIKDAAEKAASGAALSENNAAGSALAAKGSETSAANSAAGAKVSAAGAATSADSARRDAASADASKQGAATSATTAGASATTAQTAATTASASKSAAAKSASDASTAAIAAKASEDRAVLAETGAGTSAGSASTSASQAAASAAAALTSQNTAKLSETNAGQSASDAALSATKAADAALSAGKSATKAAGHATDAQTQATNAATSATEAQQAALDAKQAATMAASDAAAAAVPEAVKQVTAAVALDANRAETAAINAETSNVGAQKALEEAKLIAKTPGSPSKDGESVDLKGINSATPIPNTGFNHAGRYPLYGHEDASALPNHPIPGSVGNEAWGAMWVNPRGMYPAQLFMNYNGKIFSRISANYGWSPWWQIAGEPVSGVMGTQVCSSCNIAVSYGSKVAGGTLIPAQIGTWFALGEAGAGEKTMFMKVR